MQVLRSMSCFGLAMLVWLSAAPVAAQEAAQAGAPDIVGIESSQRPENAPVITTFSKDGQWYLDSLHGVSEPYPYSLRFLEDQGAWFTPFNKPGMPGPYDIRGWH